MITLNVTTSQFVLALFLAINASLQAETRDIDRLSDAASAIVVGDIQSGLQTGNAMTFNLSVVRSLKGQLVPGTTISVTWSSAIRANRPLKGYYGLWFLKKPRGWVLSGVLQGQYPLEYAYFPLPKTTGPALSILNSPNPIDLVAAELFTAIQLYSDRSLLYHLESGFMGVGNSAVSPLFYAALRASSDPELKFIGLAGFLLSGDSSALADLANDPDTVTRVQARNLVSSALSRWRDSDPTAVRNIGKIASSSDQAIQSSAAQVLEYIHTRDTLPFLAFLLENQSAWIRESAIRGFSRFVDNLPIETVYNIPNGQSLTQQGPTRYRTLQTDRYSLSRRVLGQESDVDYIQFWKSWWSIMEPQLKVSN